MLFKNTATLRHIYSCFATLYEKCRYILKEGRILKSKILPSPFRTLLILLLISLFIIFSIFYFDWIIHSVNANSTGNPKISSKSLIKDNDRSIAFVEPTFTYAAYQNGSFYNFYQKFSPILYDTDYSLTTNINLLKDRPIPHGPFPYYSHPSYLDIPYKEYFDLLLQHMKNYSTSVTNITDVDVHQGKIFHPDGKNAYDVLFLFHNEYLTQTEYNNLKQFVTNGGTIVFTEANILYAEVNYNKTSDSITLVNGHDWKFDGITAQKGLSERWLKENKEWMGSNFLNIPDVHRVYFANNPFNYTHTEEQYVTNPNAIILLNYHAYNLPSKYSNATIATYMMDYGKGEIINLGIWGHTLKDNSMFLKYFDNVIIPIALNSSITKDNPIFLNLNNIYQKNSLGLKNLPINKTQEISSPSLRNITENLMNKFIPACNSPSYSIFIIDQFKINCIETKNPPNQTIIISFNIPIK